jgi:hypothetical protein
MKNSGMNSIDFRDNLKISHKPGLIEICSYDCQLTIEEAQLLGFIHFQYDKKTLEGVLTLSNFNANLQRWHLTFGGTSKKKDNTQTGQHGEGLQMAIVQFRKHPHCHSVRIESSGFHWRFDFDGDKQLLCNLTRIGRDKIRKEKRDMRKQEGGQTGYKPEDQPRTTRSRCWSDVTIIVGEPRIRIGENGAQEQGRKILLHDFENFQELCLDIKKPKTVRTRYGELIIDEDQANKIYLHGLRMEHNQVAEKRYHFGYNFNSGYTDRERRAVGKSGEPWNESSFVNAIWAEVLRDRREEYIGIYTDMVLNSLDELADVTLITNGRYIAVDVIKMIWSHMRTINVNEDGKSAFYHAPNILSNVS